MTGAFHLVCSNRPESHAKKTNKKKKQAEEQQRSTVVAVVRNNTERLWTGAPAGYSGATYTRAGARIDSVGQRRVLLTHDNDTNVNGATGLCGAAFQFFLLFFSQFT